MEEIIETLEYPATLATGLFGPHDDLPLPIVADAAEAQETPLPVVIVDCEGSGDAD